METKLEKKERFNQYKKILLDIIIKSLPDSNVYLFGSRARQTHQEGADIDLALDNVLPIPHSTMAVLCDDIEESNVPLFVDLVDLHSCSQDFKDEIKKEMIIWKE
jgi:predicted nucleotidyltransferase